MTVKEFKKVIETLPNDLEVVISADIGGNRPFNFCELEEISIGYLDGAAELEKENSELKAFKQDCIKLTEDNVVMAKQRGETVIQLTKAKELISKKFMEEQFKVAKKKVDARDEEKTEKETC